MKTTFRIYQGLAGEPDVLLTAISENGATESALVDTYGTGGLRRLRKTKNKLMKKLEVITGNKHTEE